jgi:NADH-quinone oxidoreductase subunit C
MSPEKPLVDVLHQRFGEAVQEGSGSYDQLTLVVDRAQLVAVCQLLKDEPELRYNILMDIAGVDYLGREPRFEVVYHLYSIPHNRRLRLKVRVSESDSVVPSLTSVWTTANWHEREAFDMLGIRFSDHPDLRRIYMPDDYPGHPLRKDFPILGPEAEVNPRDDVHRLQQAPPPFISKLWRKGDIRGKSNSRGTADADGEDR